MLRTRWLRRKGTRGQYHRFTEGARVSCCGMLRAAQDGLEEAHEASGWRCASCERIRVLEVRRTGVPS